MYSAIVREKTNQLHSTTLLNVFYTVLDWTRFVIFLGDYAEVELHFFFISLGICILYLS